MLIGSLLATAGYLLPWFKRSSFYDWWFSGWSYASLSTGGGWTLFTFGWLVVALAASLWAGRSVAAAMTGLVAAAGAAILAVAVVALSFAMIPERDSLNGVAVLPFGPGLPALGAGLGLIVAGGVRAIAVAVTRRPPR